MKKIKDYFKKFKLLIISFLFFFGLIIIFIMKLSSNVINVYYTENSQNSGEILFIQDILKNNNLKYKLHKENYKIKLNKNDIYLNLINNQIKTQYTLIPYKESFLIYFHHKDQYIENEIYSLKEFENIIKLEELDDIKIVPKLNNLNVFYIDKFLADNLINTDNFKNYRILYKEEDKIKYNLCIMIHNNNLKLKEIIENDLKNNHYFPEEKTKIIEENYEDNELKEDYKVYDNKKNKLFEYYDEEI